MFTWVLEGLAAAGLVKGQTIGIDATTLEANAALRSIVRRDTGDTYQTFLTQIPCAETFRHETSTREIWRGLIGSGRRVCPLQFSSLQ